LEEIHSVFESKWIAAKVYGKVRVLSGEGMIERRQHGWQGLGCVNDSLPRGAVWEPAAGRSDAVKRFHGGAIF